MNPIVSLEDVSLRYHSIGGETSAVSHLSLSVQAGEFISIVGPSGCPGTWTRLSATPGRAACPFRREHLHRRHDWLHAPEGLSPAMAEHPFQCPARLGNPEKADPRKHRLC